MGILDCASSASIWRGYDYYTNHKVTSILPIQDYIYSAKVQGRDVNTYSVVLNLKHPRKCSCTCPHANGKRIICKHIVATYFSIFPEEAERILEEAENYQYEQEAYNKLMYTRVCHYIKQMKKAELQEALLELLQDGPEWQYERFIKQNELDNY